MSHGVRVLFMDAIDLSVILENWKRVRHHLGAILLGVDFDGDRIILRFSCQYQAGDRSWRELIVRARDVEDWHFAPSHTLCEGTNALELVTDDPKLSLAYLESLHGEYERTHTTQHPLMLRHGKSYVIAGRIVGDWDDRANSTQ